jgi:putative flippase GtrA
MINCRFTAFLLARVGQYARLSLSGLAATGVNYGVLYLLLGILGTETLIAATTAFILSSSTNFVLQKYWAFRDMRRAVILRQLGAYAAVTIVMLAVNDATYYVLAELLRLNGFFTATVATALVSIIGLGAAWLIFREHSEEPAPYGC